MAVFDTVDSKCLISLEIAMRDLVRALKLMLQKVQKRLVRIYTSCFLKKKIESFVIFDNEALDM